VTETPEISHPEDPILMTNDFALEAIFRTKSLSIDPSFQSPSYRKNCHETKELELRINSNQMPLFIEDEDVPHQTNQNPKEKILISVWEKKEKTELNL